MDRPACAWRSSAGPRSGHSIPSRLSRQRQQAAASAAMRRTDSAVRTNRGADMLPRVDGRRSWVGALDRPRTLYQSRRQSVPTATTMSSCSTSAPTKQFSLYFVRARQLRHQRVPGLPDLPSTPGEIRPSRWRHASTTCAWATAELPPGPRARGRIYRQTVDAVLGHARCQLRRRPADECGRPTNDGSRLQRPTEHSAGRRSPSSSRAWVSYAIRARCTRGGVRGGQEAPDTRARSRPSGLCAASSSGVSRTAPGARGDRVHEALELASASTYRSASIATCRRAVSSRAQKRRRGK